ncbi:fructokinase [Scopulibacillus daqui]|uniref:Fructokinase n=1 Tax=Scopulibacillus daqui TaxID=1469162 RepID=A0ABS2PW12_9BACL|nr:PfkB family carbohydrate kinase [Scopulibacillus daqui]MBM7643900.1 fructokinase [Scopulibacillus daqui]
MTLTNKCISIGDAAVEFIPVDEKNGLKDAQHYEREASGVAALTAAAVAVMGAKCQMVGKTGNDAFGEFLIETLKSNGVDVNYFSQTPKANTSVSFISADDRETIFFRESSADMLLKSEDIHSHWFEKGDVLFFSSMPLIKNTSRAALETAINLAGRNGCMITFAPRLSVKHWPNETITRETILHFIPHSHILILDEDECRFLTNKTDEYAAAKQLFTGKTKLLIIKKGKQGLTYVTRRERGHIDYLLETVNPIGAGEEAFIGSLIYECLRKEITPETINEVIYDRIVLEDLLLKALASKWAVCKEKGKLSALQALKGLVK